MRIQRLLSGRWRPLMPAAAAAATTTNAAAETAAAATAAAAAAAATAAAALGIGSLRSVGPPTFLCILLRLHL